MGGRNCWTDAESAELERLWRQGLTDRQIAEALGTRTASACNSRREAMGLTGPSRGTPSRPRSDKPCLPACAEASASRPDRQADLMAIWDRWNERLRERLRAEGELIE